MTIWARVIASQKLPRDSGETIFAARHQSRALWELAGKFRRSQELGKSKRGLTNGGLSPKFSEKIGQKSFRENRALSGLIGTFSGAIGAFSGLIGTDSSAPHSRGEAAEIPPKGPFWAQLAPFGLSPRLLSPPLDFPKRRPLWSSRRESAGRQGRTATPL